MPGLHGFLFIAALLGLVFMALIADVSRHRVSGQVMLGDGGNEQLRRAIRAHANFAEYVPLILILLAGCLFAGAPPDLILCAGAVLVMARILHPLGMHRPFPNMLRAGGACLTWLVLAFASVEAIYLTF